MALSKVNGCRASWLCANFFVTEGSGGKYDEEGGMDMVMWPDPHWQGG